MPPSPGDPPRPPPGRRDLKSTILWCSRWLVGDGQFYQGKLKVEIAAAEEGETVVVKPVRGMDGLSEPGAGALGGVRSPEAAGATRSELLRVLFSEEERRILRALAAKEPSKAADVLDRCKLEKSKFWTLWSNLQQRGVVGDADAGEGFVILLEWVRSLVGEVGGVASGHKPAA